MAIQSGAAKVLVEEGGASISVANFLKKFQEFNDSGGYLLWTRKFFKNLQFLGNLIVLVKFWPFNGRLSW